MSLAAVGLDSALGRGGARRGQRGQPRTGAGARDSHGSGGGEGGGAAGALRPAEHLGGPPRGARPVEC